MATPEQIVQVRKALEDPRYTWRTVSSIAEDAHVSTENVREILDVLRDDVIQSDVEGPEGEELFTTRLHYRRKAPWWRRFIAALRNRAT